MRGPLSPMARRAWERMAGALSIGAAVVHGGLAPEHFEEWWGYGLFFAIAAAAQLVLGLALLLDPFDPTRMRMSLRRARLLLYTTGAAGQVVLVAFYVVTRTVGVPLFGPEAGEVEPVSTVDLVAKALEVGCALVLVMLAVQVKDIPSRARST